MAWIAGFGVRRRPTLYAGVIGAVLAACVLLVGLDGWRTWQARSLQITADEAETANLARSLAQHAHDTIQAADTAVLAVRDRLEAGDFSAEKLKRVQGQLVDHAQTLPVIHGLFVYDAAGNWIINSVSPAAAPLNNSDRPYFQYHRTHADRGTYVGEPLRSRSDGLWIIPVSRRLDRPDGSFAGVVLATVAVTFFQDFYGTFDIGPQGSIGLSSADGIVIARKPHDDGTTGTDISRGPIFHELLPRAPVGSFESTSPLDGVYRLGSYRRVQDYPLVVIVAHALDDVLADWRWDAGIHLAVSGAVAIVLALLGMRLALQIKQRQAAEVRYRLLAENSGDVIMCLDHDGRRLYVSPAFTAMTGWSVEEALRWSWDQQIHPDDQPTVSAARDELFAGTSPVTTSYRYICKDGSPLWVEARLRIAPGRHGERAQVVVNIRDITERKAAEEKLEILNRELAGLASTDGLTGLANRRRFDEVLALEYRRMARDLQPLSLLMIDVDRFKLYNDRYGHPQGDGCLRAVAAAVGASARRPGDLAARYGGEEIVLLLPGTDADGAAEVGERVRAAIEALQIEHEGNPPSGVVTGSIGVATSAPVLEEHTASPDDLVAAADAALYEAKRTGRNRVVTEAMVPRSPDAASPPPDEERRLVALARYGALDAPAARESLDRIAY